MAEQTKLDLAPAINAGQVAGVIIFLVAIIVGAYFLTKYLGQRAMSRGTHPGDARKRGSRKSTQAGRQRYSHRVNVVDRIAVDRDKTLMVVEFEDKYYLIGMTPSGFTRIDQVEGRWDDPRAEAGASSEETPPGPDEAEARAPRGAVQQDGPASADRGAAQSSVSDNTARMDSANAPDAKTIDNAAKATTERARSRGSGRRLPDMPDSGQDETFGQRFRRAFGIVLQSYLPSGMRQGKDGRSSSFDEELKKRMRGEDDDT